MTELMNGGCSVCGEVRFSCRRGDCPKPVAPVPDEVEELAKVLGPDGDQPLVVVRRAEAAKAASTLRSQAQEKELARQEIAGLKDRLEAAGQEIAALKANVARLAREVTQRDEDETALEALAAELAKRIGDLETYARDVAEHFERSGIIGPLTMRARSLLTQETAP